MSTTERFRNKVAIVTGAAGGIGEAICRRLLSEGATVTVVDRADNAERACERLRAAFPERRILPAVCDVSSENDVEKTVSSTLLAFDRVDIVVNNAGMMIFKTLEDHSAEDWNRVLSVDLLGAFYFIRQAFLKMKNGGTIVNISSIHAVETTPMVAAYAAAKAALVSLTRSAAIEGEAKRIRANAILPGAIDAPMLWANPNIKAGREVVQKADIGKPEDVAALVAYLASEDSTFIRGAAICIDGGRLSRL